MRQTPTLAGWRLLIAGKEPPASVLLERQDAWVAAITDYIAGLERALASAEVA